MIPSVYNHFNMLASKNADSVSIHVSKRETVLRDENMDRHSSDFKLKALMPILKTVVNYDTNQILTQVTRKSKPKSIQTLSNNCLGYLELIDLNDKNIRYLEVPRPSANSARNDMWQSYTHLSATNETEFLFDVSANKSGGLYTLDFYGNLKEWETSKMSLQRSLDDWQKLVMDKESRNLKLEFFKDSPNKELREFKGPKHGKVDENNEPHVGGNQWAGNFETQRLSKVKSGKII
jgi:hypothetical protein